MKRSTMAFWTSMLWLAIAQYQLAARRDSATPIICGMIFLAAYLILRAIEEKL